MRAIVESDCGIEVRAVLSDRADAAGLAWAAARGIEARAVASEPGAGRAAHEARLVADIERLKPDYILLAGFMRILGEDLVQRYEGRMLNIHPSLLPAFPGLHTHRRALEAGVRLHGATVHFVTPSLDDGPIVAQAAVPVLDGDTEESLAARVLAVEHRIYPKAVRWVAEGRVELGSGKRVRVRGIEAPADRIEAPREAT